MRKSIGVLLLVWIPGILAAQESIQDVVNLICKMRNIDQVREHVFQEKGFNSQYVVNGELLDFRKFLTALEDARSLGTAGMYQDTTFVQAIYDGSSGSAMFMSVLHSRLDDGDVEQEARVSLMTFWKIGQTWKMLHWHQATLKKD